MMDDEVEEFLAHYGVKGMKWGVRKATTKSVSKAYRKASRKQRRLNVKAKKKAIKGHKLSIRGIRKNNSKLHFKGLRLQMKAAKLDKKSDKWETAMREVFKDVNVSDIDPKSLERGSEFVYMLINK